MSARELTKLAFSNWIERRKRIMGDSDVAEAECAQDAQNYANMAVPNWGNAQGQLAPFGYGIDPATHVAAKEYARVQQSVMLLQQAAAIRADKPLMEAIRKYLRDEKARVSRLMDEIG